MDTEDCFHALALVNSGAMNVGEHVSFPMIFSECMPMSAIAGLEAEILDSTCKWYHMVFVFLWLNYFT